MLEDIEQDADACLVESDLARHPVFGDAHAAQLPGTAPTSLMCHSVEKSAAQSQFCAASEPPGRVKLTVEHSVAEAGARVMISVRAMTSMSSSTGISAPCATAATSSAASGDQVWRRARLDAAAARTSSSAMDRKSK